MLNFFQDRYPSTFPSIDMPSLNHLELRGVSVNAALSALTSFSAPHLTFLILSGTDPSTDKHTNAAQYDLPRGKFPRLTTLYISEYPLCATLRLITLLQCPSITNLGTAPIEEEICGDHLPYNSDYTPPILSVSSYAFLGSWEAEGGEVLPKRIFELVPMSRLKHLVLYGEALTASQRLSIVERFAEIETLTMLFRGTYCRLSLIDRGHYLIEPLLFAAKLTTTNLTDIVEPSAELAFDVSLRHYLRDWSEINNVERVVIAGCNLNNTSEVDAAVERIRHLSSRSNIPRPPNRPTSWKASPAWLMSKGKSLGLSIIQFNKEPTFPYPNLRSLTVHAYDPFHQAVFDNEIIEALKIYVNDRRKAKAGPLEIRLWPPPPEKDLQWFNKNGNTCFFTSSRDTTRFVNAAARLFRATYTRLQVENG
jgi:hypothetical protein